MARAATTVLIVLALFNIAHADLLRPCQCGPDNPMSCGQCPSGRSRPASRSGPASRSAEERSPAPC